MPELEAVQRTANRVRDMWEAGGRRPVGLLEFSEEVGVPSAIAYRMLSTTACEGLIEKTGRGKGYLPILPEANRRPSKNASDVPMRRSGGAVRR